MRASPQEAIVATSMEEEGWSVFNTNNGFPDLFCVKDGKMKLVEVKWSTDRLKPNQSTMIEALKRAGVPVEVIHRSRIGITQVTIEITDSLYDQAKKYAIDHHTTLKELFESAIRKEIEA